MRQFYLERYIDESGVSGTGIVACGVILPSGRVVMEWVTGIASLGVYDSVDEVETVHGHGGKTRVVFTDIDEDKKMTIDKVTEIQRLLSMRLPVNIVADLMRVTPYEVRDIRRDGGR